MPYCCQQRLEQRHAPEGLEVAVVVMAVARRMAARDDHPVGAFDERLEDELGIDAARAHHADDVHVRRLLHAAHAGRVGGRVGAPVAQKPNDSGFEAVVTHRFSFRCAQRKAYRTAAMAGMRNSPSISARICRSEKWRAVMAPAGQAATQVPQPLHSASLISATPVAPWTTKLMAV